MSGYEVRSTHNASGWGGHLDMGYDGLGGTRDHQYV